jgi:HAMP domain-containing protein
MKLTKSLTGKISFGYITITVVTVITFVCCFFILNKNKKADQEISENSVPTLILFKDINMLSSEITRLSNSWIYTPNVNDKTAMERVLSKDFPDLKKKLKEIESSTSNDKTKADLKKVTSELDQLVSFSKNIMTNLASDEDYADDAKVDAALTAYEKNFLPKSQSIDKFVDSSIKTYYANLSAMQTEKNWLYNILYVALILMLTLIMATGIVSLFISNKIIVKPINELKTVVNALAQGEIIEISTNNSNDEIGEMKNSVKNMTEGLKVNTNFAVEIGKGNYEVAYSPLSEKDQMGNALIGMKESLMKNALEDNKRNWATVGVAKIGDILRNNHDIEILYDSIIKFIVNYLGANQGGLFIAENDPEAFLELKSCYAYERKKFQQKRIEPGEGLIGQCYLEGETIYITEVPNEYIHITSGLGTASPNCIVIVPLKINEAIFGIIEVASFKVLEKHHLDFIEKLGESIASTISNVKTTQKTKQLLEDSQLQAEMLRAQEEEMRQNMEELSATQEEMQRKEQDYIQMIDSLKMRKV